MCPLASFSGTRSEEAFIHTTHRCRAATNRFINQTPTNGIICPAETIIDGLATAGRSSHNINISSTTNPTHLRVCGILRGPGTQNGFSMNGLSDVTTTTTSHEELTTDKLLRRTDGNELNEELVPK